MRPADRATLDRALTELALLTKAKEGDADTERLQIALYMERLSGYPADAVLHACRSWADGNVFWPSWAELRELLEERVAERQKMLRAFL